MPWNEVQYLLDEIESDFQKEQKREEGKIKLFQSGVEAICQSLGYTITRGR